MYLSCNNAKILRYGAQKLYMFIIIIIWKEKENLTTILRQYLLLKLPSLLLLTNFSRFPSNICKIWLNPSEQSDSDPKNRRQIGDKRFPSIFEGVINPLRQEWRKRILKSRPRDPRFAEDADLNSPLTTRLLSAYFFHYKWQNVLQRGDPETRSFFHKFSRHSGRPWRFPSGGTSGHKCKLWSAEQHQHHAGAIGYCDPVIGPARSCLHELSTCHLNAHHRPTLLLLLPSFLSRRCLCHQCSPNSFSRRLCASIHSSFRFIIENFSISLSFSLHFR